MEHTLSCSPPESTRGMAGFFFSSCQDYRSIDIREKRVRWKMSCSFMTTHEGLFADWQHRRRFALPDEDEVALKRRIVNIVSRQADRKRSHPAQNHAEDLESSSDAHHHKASDTVVLPRRRESSSSSPSVILSPPPRSGGLDLLPIDLLRLIFHFVPVVYEGLIADLAQMRGIMTCDDGLPFRDPSRHAELLRALDGGLDVHYRHFAEASVLARSLNPASSRRIALLKATAAIVYDANSQCHPHSTSSDSALDAAESDEAAGMLMQHMLQHHPQRCAYYADIRYCRRELDLQYARHHWFAKFRLFRRDVHHRPCHEVACRFRMDIAEWQHYLTLLQDQRRDVASALALSDVADFSQHAPAVEYLGHHTMETDDLRNMFWEVGLPSLPEGIEPSSYPRSITVQQAIHLGLTRIPWVKGYVWEGQGSQRTASSLPGGGGALMPFAHVQDGFERLAGAAAVPAGARNRDSRSSGADNVSQSSRGGGGLLAALGEGGDSSSLVQAQLDHVAREDAVRHQQRRRQLIPRALTVAADGMTQHICSVQTLTDPNVKRPGPLYQRQWSGCELCAQLPIHHVGLKKHEGRLSSSSAASGDGGGDGVASPHPDDIVLCEACYQAEYAKRMVIHVLYDWFNVRDDLLDHREEVTSRAS